MNKTFRWPKLSLAVTMLMTAPFAQAQVRGGHDAYMKDPRTSIVNAVEEKAGKLMARAERLLADKKLLDARLLASEAIQLCADASVSYTRGHVFLAEVLLREGRPEDTLAELSLIAGYAGEHPIFTKAIALARLGRNRESYAVLVDAAGVAGSEGGRLSDIRTRDERWSLPMDQGLSLATLAATGYILRADISPDRGWSPALNDIVEAERLVPNSPLVHYMFYTRLMGRDDLDGALAHLNRATQLGGSETAERLRLRETYLRALIEKRDKASAGSPP